MKGIATDTRHKIQMYQIYISALSVQKHLGPSHAIIHQSVHNNPTKLGGGQERHSTLSSFLSNPQYKGSVENSEGTKIHKYLLHNLFCLSQLVPEMTHLPETEVTELGHGNGVMQTSFASSQTTRCSFTLSLVVATQLSPWLAHEQVAQKLCRMHSYLSEKYI